MRPLQKQQDGMRPLQKHNSSKGSSFSLLTLCGKINNLILYKTAFLLEVGNKSWNQQNTHKYKYQSYLVFFVSAQICQTILFEQLVIVLLGHGFFPEQKVTNVINMLLFFVFVFIFTPWHQLQVINRWYGKGDQVGF